MNFVVTVDLPIEILTVVLVVYSLTFIVKVIINYLKEVEEQ